MIDRVIGNKLLPAGVRQDIVEAQEGQITRLMLVKRQVYGRGKLDLPQARLLAAH